MEITTECVQPAVNTVRIITSRYIRRIFKIYYHLTAYVPRRLPRTEDELKSFKRILMDYYDLEDRPEVWYTVAGQMTSTPPINTRKAYGNMVNAAKRLKTNAIAQKIKEDIVEAHEQRIAKITENIIASARPEPLQP